jgi:alkanesulfonate monooxygenase SsuD/methylene tetrahydromethanopterin reductase-like flavin-dependent oxidoreductase (luciferase family)
VRAAICVPNFGTYADPHAVVRLAREAEAAGWDGFFVWDHLSFVWGPPAADPWILLAAIASATTRVRIGTAVAVLPRRRPHVVALAAATLDRLSEGRLTLGVGIGGGHDEYSPFGEASEPRERAARLDEALEVVDALWSGERVEHQGPRFRASGVTLGALPVQRPRTPVWVGGNAPASLRRAARWDGWIADSAALEEMRFGPEELARGVETIASARGGLEGFDVAAMGYTADGGDGLAGEFEEAGATWWIEVFHDARGDRDAASARVASGPPR